MSLFKRKLVLYSQKYPHLVVLYLFFILTILSLLTVNIVKKNNFYIPDQSKKAVLGFATITKDNVSSATYSGSSPATWNHTTGNQSNRILIVSIHLSSGDSASSVTYDNGAQALTRLTTQTFGPSNDNRLEIWYLNSPNVGTNKSIRINGSNPFTVLSGGAITYYNVDLNNPLAPFVTRKGGITMPPLTTNVPVSASVNQLVFDTIGVVQAGGPNFLPLSGQTQEWARGGNAHWNGGSSKAGGATSVGWSINSGPGVNWAEIAVPVNPLFIPDPTPIPTNIPTPTNTPSPTPTPTPLPIYTISGNVYLDLNKNEIKDGGEANFASGTVVTLSGSASRTATTNSTGNYSFASLFAGTYNVTLTLPPGHANTSPISKSITFP